MLANVASRIQCPTLIVYGEEDAQIPVAEAQKLYDAVGSRQKQLKILTRAEGGVDHYCPQKVASAGFNW